MAVSEIELASLLCSRLCHDLLNPVGSITNGLELLADEKDPEMRERCMELLADSASTSAQKLKFFRLAFGSAGGFGDMVDAREPETLIRGMLPGNGRTSLIWSVDAEELPKPAVKILLNLALVGANTLVRGGELTIGAERRNHATEIAIRASGDKLVLDEEIAATLTSTDMDSELTPRTAAAYMVRAMAAQANGSIQLAQDTNMLVIGTAIAD